VTIVLLPIHSQLNFFDVTEFSCAYILPDDFFRLVCNPNNQCGDISFCEETPDILDFSLTIFRNPRLKVIGGFATLKYVESNIYIIFNISLHTINAFGQLVFALDIWIRNNTALKYIIGFNNLQTIRDFVVFETPCLLDLNNIKALDFAQRITVEEKTANALKLPKTPIPSVLGYAIYFSFEHKL